MKLVKRTSDKHPGAIFLKVRGTDDFVCKIYRRSDDDGEGYAIANAIIAALESIDVKGHNESYRDAVRRCHESRTGN